MKKSSLGRRNSNRPSVQVGGMAGDTSTNLRNSRIPVPNARSTSCERQSVCNVPSKLNKASSGSNLHMLDLITPHKTPLSSRFQTGGATERPSRSTAASSIGTSSYGGHTSKRDMRPLQEKEWQEHAINFIETEINKNPEGAASLGLGLKPLSLAKFIDACSLLFSMIDSSIEITKHNYIKELPFLCKTMQYRGKVEKSWMIAVSSQHAFPYALGLLHFLAQCAFTLNNTSIDSLMFPPKFDENIDCEMNFQILIPYYNDSYSLFKSNNPNYQSIQNELGSLVMEEHYNQDDALGKRGALLEEIRKLERENEEMSHARELEKQEVMALEMELNKLAESVKDRENSVTKCRNAIKKQKTDLADFNSNMGPLENEIASLKEQRAKLLETSGALEGVENVELMKEQLEREIVSNKKYIQSYEDMIYTEDIEILKLRTEIEELSRESNLRVLKYLHLEPELEKMNLPSNIETFDPSVVENCGFESLKEKLESQIFDLESQVNDVKIERDKLRKKCEDLKNANHSKQYEVDCQKKELDQLQETYDQMKRSLETVREQTCRDDEAFKEEKRLLKSLAEEKQALLEEKEKELKKHEAILIDAIKKMTERASFALTESNKLIGCLKNKSSCEE